MSNENEEPPSTTAQPRKNKGKAAGLAQKSTQESLNGDAKGGVFAWVKDLLRGKSEPTLREAIEVYIDEPENFETDPISEDERMVLTNTFKLRDVSVVDIMIPRADIVAIDANTTKEELLSMLADIQFSRIPVYHDTLDEVLGTIHIKDVVAAMAKGETPNIQDMVTDIPIVSPSMPILDLVLKMRQSRRHMALVVDEYGGIDGLVTIGDVIESIVGDIDDEHDADEDMNIVEQDDGSILVDARLAIKDFEEKYSVIFSDEEREESDTLGGLVFLLAGRVPARGEVLTHPSGMVFEVLEADPRRINLLRVRNIPSA